jgi:hypothetical protein
MDDQEGRWRVGVLRDDLTFGHHVHLCLVKYADAEEMSAKPHIEHAIGVIGKEVDNWVDLPPDLFRVTLDRPETVALIEMLRARAGLPDEAEKYKQVVETQRQFIEVLLATLTKVTR